jgi:hypothetical protein
MEDDLFGGISDSVADVTDSLSDTLGNVADSIGDIASDALGGISDIAAGALTGAAIGALGGILGGLTTLDPDQVLSSYRRQGIPYGAELDYDNDYSCTKFSSSPSQKDWRVSLFSEIILQSAALSPLSETNGMIFPYLPSIQFQSSAHYDPIQTTHSNYPFYAYRNSQVDDISITGTFTVQDQKEGIYWLAVMHFLRTVTKMYFGRGPNLGNPPPICTLNGYGDFVFNNVSVVVKAFNINFQKDVDYIAVKGPMGLSYVPTRSDITVTVTPVYSRDKVKKFNLTSFANGKLVTGRDGKGWL